MNLVNKLKLRLNKHFGWEFFVKSAYGPKLVALYDFTNKINITGSHSKIVEDSLELLTEGDCFVDIGANTGIFSLLASQKVGKEGMVISFEPNPLVFRILQKNIIENHANNVLPFCTGISNEEQVSSFVFDPQHNGLGHMKADQNYKWDRKNQIECKVLCLGESSLNFLNKACESRKNVVVKIDTEGAELKVLQGIKNFLLESKPKKIVVELSTEHLQRFGHTVKDVYDHMAELGYIGSITAENPHHYDEVFVPA